MLNVTLRSMASRLRCQLRSSFSPRNEVSTTAVAVLLDRHVRGGLTHPSE